MLPIHNSIRHQKLWTWGVACTVPLLLLALYSPPWRDSSVSLNAMGSRRRPVLLRVNANNRAGIGSIITQLRSAIALTHLLDMELAILPTPSWHGYAVADFINKGSINEGKKFNLGQVCMLGEVLPDATTLHLLDLYAKGNAASLMEGMSRYRKAFESCTTVVDERPWDYRPDLAGHTSTLVRDLLAPRAPHNSEQPCEIGLHIRWGDMVNTTGYDVLRPERSIPIEVAKSLLDSLYQCMPADTHLSVYMEKASSEELSKLNRTHTLVDSGNDLEDLLRFSTSDILLGSGSGFTMLAHEVSWHGLTIGPAASMAKLGTNAYLTYKDALAASASKLCEKTRNSLPDDSVCRAAMQTRLPLS